MGKKTDGSPLKMPLSEKVEVKSEKFSNAIFSTPALKLHLALCEVL